MADPLSITGSVVGIISLGLQAGQGLFDYYSAVKNQQSDIAHTTKKLERLLAVLETVRQQVATRKFRADEQILIKNVTACAEECKDCIMELQEEANKFKQTPIDASCIRATARFVARRVAYPIRQSTLLKLEENIDDIVNSLSFALNLLGQNDICSIQHDVEDANGLLKLVRSSQLSSSIREWLHAPDASINFNEAVKNKHPGTGHWFVKSNSFMDWLETPKSFLWLKGFAGCGKSVLCSTAIQYTFRHRRSNPQIGIAFFFFTFNDNRKQDASAMLRALLIQLSGQLDSSHRAIATLHDRYRNTTPPEEELLSCLHTIVRQFHHVYILIDALDESPREAYRQTMLTFLRDLRSWPEPGLHLLVTSRDEVDIRDEISAMPEETIEMRNERIDKDIAVFISYRLRNDRRLRDWAEYHDRIESVLTERAKGVFRWVECQLRAVMGCPQNEDLLDKLLNSLPATLDETYERMFQNIPSISVDYARRMLTLLCCAMRPLTVLELIDGLAVKVDGDNPGLVLKRKFKNIEAIQKVCPGLTELDFDPWYQVTTVRIAHFSVQEYLESDRIHQSKGAALFGIKKKLAHEEMARICLTLLLEPALSSTEHYEIEEKYPLALYAATNWVHHFRNGDITVKLQSQALELFRNEDTAFYTWATLFDMGSNISWLRGIKESGSPIYYAAKLGFDAIVYALISPDFCSHESEQSTSSVLLSLNTQCGSDGTALQAASVVGHEKIVQLLIEKGADINVQGGQYGTALQAASASGHEKIVQLLIEKGADINAQDGYYGTALQAASARGHEKIVQLLIEKGADINAEDGYYGTVLQAASVGGHEKIVQLLIEKGADINVQGGQYGTALQAASASGHEKIVQLLIEKGADINVQGGQYGTALQAASASGHEKIVQLLIEKGADINVQGGQYGTALQAASASGHEKIIQLLIEKGADINTQGGYYGTALQAASECGHEKIVQLLIKKGANINIHGGQYGTVLQAASARGHEKIVQLLIEKGADINVQGGYYRTVLQAASARGHEKIVQLLIEKGADINAQDGYYGTVLQAASAGGHEKIVQLLIEKGADINAQGGYYGTALRGQGGEYGTALQAASAGGHEKIVQLLIEKGADINAQGGEYRTALQAASECGHEKIVQLLIEKGADINA